MVVQASRSYTRLALAIVVAVFVIGGVIVASSYLGTSRTVTETIPSTVVRTSTLIQYTTTTTTLTIVGGTSQLYQVEFLQESNCPYGDWFVPWAVVLNGTMVVQPPNATVSPYTNGTGQGTGFSRTTDGNLSTIWFSVPSGTYSYKILPRFALGSEQSGNVTVDGSNIVVQVFAFVEAEGCSSTTGVQTATETSNASELVFRQVTPCPNIGYIAPWSVTLSDGQSVTAEGNSSQCCGGSPGNPSIIIFLVPNGNYTYSVMADDRLTPSAGAVNVDDQEVVVNLDLFLSSCGSTTTTS